MRPRIRTLKPEMWADERIGELTFGARLLFVGLITMADDEGRLRELTAAILGHVFPYDDVSGAKLERWLQEVASTGMVVRYLSDGRRYVAFRHWTRHQKVDRPNDSELPIPPQFSTNDSTNDRRSSPDVFDDHSRSARTRDNDPIRSDPLVSSDRDKRTGLEEARELFTFWQEQCGHPTARATRERLSKIQGRRAEGYTVDQIRKGIEGAARGAFVNDAGKRFDDIELICRNGSKLESFIDRAGKPNLNNVTALDAKRLASMDKLIERTGG